MKLRQLLAICLIVLFAQACKSASLKVNVLFDDIQGLKKGDRVVFQNNIVGAVETVQYNEDGSYTARLLVDKDFSNAFTEHSRFHIITDEQQSDHKAVDIRLLQKGGAVLQSGAKVKGGSGQKDMAARFQKNIEDGFQLIKEKFKKFSNDIQQIPQSDEYRKIKQSLSDLAEEMKRVEKQRRQKIKEEWLPKIERELEELKRRLKDLGKEKEAEPLQRDLDKIRNI
ncbi:MAG: MCE family protein [Desulfobacteraceae bacterium]|nr:MCE family protein [Desulfobacteraceae bacterium]